MTDRNTCCSNPLTLPERITIIVFWGLGLGGASLALLLMAKAEDDLRRHHAERSALALSAVEHLLKAHAAEPEYIDHELPLIQRRTGVRGLEITLPGRDYTAGDLSADGPASDRLLSYTDPEGGKPLVARVRIVQRPLEGRITRLRKQLLLGLSGGLLAFGLTLAWVLRRLLTRPFEAMVATAQAFHAGHTRLRFDEGRGDEFGYLARFMNEALDSLLTQREQLSGALHEIRRSRAELAAEKECIEVTLQAIADGVITADAQGRIQFLNPAAERLLGRPSQELKGRLLLESVQVLDEYTGLPVHPRWAACLEQGQTAEPGEHSLLVRADGGRLHVTDSAAPIRGRDGRLMGAVIIIRDVGQARRLARELSYQASHDALTGLFNRHAFKSHLEQTLTESVQGRSHHALCYLDLDQFKLINDTCGHVAGDELLRQVGALLREQLRDSDIIARLGGDEFGVILRFCPPERAQSIAEKLRAAVKAHRFVWENHGFELAVSIGVAFIHDPAQNAGELLAAVDLACYAAKDAGRDRIHVYARGDAELARRRSEMRWATRLRNALEEDRFELYAQAIEDVSAPAGAAPRHFEILLRMHDEDGRMVMPGTFIPAAERYQLMPAIDRWVIAATLGQLARMPQKTVTCAINLSGQSLGDAGLYEFIVAGIRNSKVDPARLCFEITETAAVANLNQAKRLIAALRRLGCRFALDDFGSGLSSFAYLKNLPVDYLKIDGSFVRDLGRDPIHRAMVSSIHHIGRVMGLRTIAEFVEDAHTLQALREIGVDYAQGYGIHHPQPLHELTDPGRLVSPPPPQNIK